MTTKTVLDVVFAARAQAKDTESGLRWQANCPICDDPSMQIIQEPSREFGVKCIWGGCTEQQILETLGFPDKTHIRGIDPAIEQQTQKELLRLQARDEARRRHLQLEGAINLDAIEFLPVGDLLTEEIPEAKYRVDRLWPIGGNVVLAAEAKAGKSTLALNLVKSLTEGSPFLGQFAVTPPEGKIAILDLELNRANLQDWIGRIGIKPDNVIVLPMRGKASNIAKAFRDDHSRLQFASKLREHDVEILIIDPLSVLLNNSGADENSNSEVGTILRNGIAALREDAGLNEVFVIHHAGHGGKRSRGASVILDWPDAIWTLTKDADDSSDVDDDADPDSSVTSTRYLKATGRDVELRETALEIDTDTSRLTALKEGTGRRQLAWIKRMSARERKIIDALASSGGEIVGKEELKKASGINSRDINAPLDRLLAGEMVEIGGDGKVIRGKPTTYRLTAHAMRLTEEAGSDPGEITPSPGRTVDWLASA